MKSEQAKEIATIDTVAARTLDQAVRFYGIRAVLFELQEICSKRAHNSALNFNIAQGKQWVEWWRELTLICGSSTLTDPGRE